MDTLDDRFVPGTFPERLAAIWEETGLSKAAFSTITGVSGSNIGRLINHSEVHVRKRTMDRIGHSLGMIPLVGIYDDGTVEDLGIEHFFEGRPVFSYERRVIEKRRSEGISISEISRRMGPASRSSVQNWMHGRKGLHSYSIDRLFPVLSLTPFYLVGTSNTDQVMAENLHAVADRRPRSTMPKMDKPKANVDTTLLDVYSAVIGGATYQQIADSLELPVRKVGKHLGKLHRMGLVESEDVLGMDRVFYQTNHLELSRL